MRLTVMAFCRDIAEVDNLNRLSMACPAMPLCGLAITEAERGVVDLLASIRTVLTRLGFDESVRPAFMQTAGSWRAPAHLLCSYGQALVRQNAVPASEPLYSALSLDSKWEISWICACNTSLAVPDVSGLLPAGVGTNAAPCKPAACSGPSRLRVVSCPSCLVTDPVVQEAPAVRVTGCPNGCTRPYMGEIGLVGDGPNSYQLWLGGNPEQTQLAEPYMERMKIQVRQQSACLAALQSACTCCSMHRQALKACGMPCS